MADVSSHERPTNRLAKEVSPYLQQHAHNPVDWYPWGDEAIARSRELDRPILLSIGYSACHWCHVMERESFEDPDIARVMNELFVCVKVDREERPDLDQVYQMVVQLMGRAGGWPLTVFLTPELAPFFGGTYFPPTERYGMPGLPQVLAAVEHAYRQRRDEIERSAREITAAIAQVTAPRGDPRDPPSDVVARAARALSTRFDRHHGGFGGAPKFPNTMSLDVLLRAWKRHDDAEALEHVERTLNAMRSGGIYDQIGGGFHRYSVDERWAMPHFEKMLYDNALLARLHVDAWRATRTARHAATARDTLEYVLREMCSPEGAFYSTQDADSEGEEGKFFVWTAEQLREVLGEEDARVAAARFGVTDGGNFENGATVMHEARSVHELAEDLGLPEEQVRATVERIRTRLFDAREGRVKPFRDEKVIASWNGLAIGAFAEAGAALDEPRFVDAATRALAFVRRQMWSDGSLARIHKDGQTKGKAFLEDYADLAGAAVDVYEATADPEALRFGRQLADAAIERFWDDGEGGFFFAEASDDLLVRTKDSFDNAVPSGTSSITHALLRLHALTGDDAYLERAERNLRLLSPLAIEQPMAFGHLLGAMDRYVNGPTQVLVVGRAGDDDARALLQVARRAHLPNRALVLVDPEEEDGRGPVSLLGGRRQQGGRATAYVCRDRTCGLPLNDPEALSGSL